MFEKIVLAIDGSDASRRAGEVAAMVAKLSGAEVLVFHGRERESVAGGKLGSVFDIETDTEAVKLVDDALKTLKDAGVSARSGARAVMGRVAEEIVETARAENAGLIVMGTRGLSDRGGLFLGSVTHRVLHFAETPVLVVK